MEGRELPRPPRRIPAGAGQLTQLESSMSHGPQPPPRQPWRFGRILAGFIVLLIIVAGGAAAGWWIRSQSVSTDPASPPASGPGTPTSTPRVRLGAAAVTASAGPAVVRVLATTCAGTGEATGALIAGEKILTAASAIKEPLSIVIVTPDNRIRRANLLGTSTDGVAVLRMIGRVGATPLPLADTEPDPNAERALIGYTAAGKQTIQNIGTPAQPTDLSTVMNAAKLGGPVLGKSGEVVGVVVGDKVPDSTIVGVDKLRGYVAPGSTGITAKLGDCPRSRGPRTPVAPELQVASTPLAVEAQRLLASFYTLMNRHDFEAVQPLYSKRLARSLTAAQDRRGHQTTYFFLPKVTELTRTDTDAEAARVSLNVL
ncbi:MAG TPA: trypsin-like peptidase domain-containing protein, partial [Kribbella sp.]|nr:trypsin-like peptidase domain-containing protein [Kribbella sp.]